MKNPILLLFSRERSLLCVLCEYENRSKAREEKTSVPKKRSRFCRLVPWKVIKISKPAA